MLAPGKRDEQDEPGVAARFGGLRLHCSSRALPCPRFPVRASLSPRGRRWPRCCARCPPGGSRRKRNPAAGPAPRRCAALPRAAASPKTASPGPRGAAGAGVGSAPASPRPPGAARVSGSGWRCERGSPSAGGPPPRPPPLCRGPRGVTATSRVRSPRNGSAQRRELTQTPPRKQLSGSHRAAEGAGESPRPRAAGAGRELAQTVLPCVAFGAFSANEFRGLAPGPVKGAPRGAKHRRVCHRDCADEHLKPWLGDSPWQRDPGPAKLQEQRRGLTGTCCEGFGRETSRSPIAARCDGDRGWRKRWLWEESRSWCCVCWNTAGNSGR